MQLIFKYFADESAYRAAFDFDGLGPCAVDAARFWRARVTELVREAGMRAIVWDGLDFTWLSADARLADPLEQSIADAGLADAALVAGLTIRMDLAAPSDVLASVQRGAVTAQRVTGDANPTSHSEGRNWVELGDNALLTAALGVRPMADVLWTQPTQPDDPRWRGGRRRNLRHDVALAVLTSGPVGFGDSVGRTDARMLVRASRADGAILKPAFPALRLDRWFTARGGAELRLAVAGPAGSADPRYDARANSMARLHAAASDPAAKWWWIVLATNVGGEERTVDLSELWPRPPVATQLLVVQLDAHASGRNTSAAGPPEAATQCAHGAAAASCAFLWSATRALNVTTAPGTPVQRSFRLLAAAPLLSSGWALLGELDKICPVSPQRFVAPGSGDAPHDTDLVSAASELTFTVLGAPGESVRITLIAPPGPVDTHDARHGDAQSTVTAPRPLDGKVVVVTVAVGQSGRSMVACQVGACTGVSSILK